MSFNYKTLFKINNLIDNEEFLNTFKTGVYSAVSLDPKALGTLWKYLKKVGIPMQRIENAHVTIIHSRTRPTQNPQIKEIFGEVIPKKFGIFGKGTKYEPYVLVLEVKSQALEKAHQEFIRQGLKPTYREYAPHITLVLDITRLFPGLKHMSAQQKKNITNIFDKMIPELPRSIKIQKLKIEPLK